MRKKPASTQAAGSGKNVKSGQTRTHILQQRELIHMLEKFTIYGVGKDGKRFAKTEAFYDTKLKRVVEGRTEYLVDKKEVDRRVAAISPVSLVVQR